MSKLLIYIVTTKIEVWFVDTSIMVVDRFYDWSRRSYAVLFVGDIFTQNKTLC